MPSTDPAKLLARELASLRREVRSLGRASQAAYRSIEVDGQTMSLPQVAQTGLAAVTSADAAAQTADSAAQTAADAAAAAAAATEAASVATSAAQGAATQADSAEAAALEAAGIAASKGRIVYTSSEPTGDESTLWIRLPDNVPNRWTGAAWVPISDAGIQAAASAAAAASDAAAAAAQAAQGAQTMANTANGVAGTALSTAQGKNTVTYSTAIPTSATPGIRAGDLWFQRGTTSGVITGTWEWDGSTWLSRVFGDAVLGSLTVGKLVTGELAAGTRIIAGSIAAPHAEMTSTGFVTYAKDPGTGLIYEATRVGDPTVGDRWAGTNPDGTSNFSIVNGQAAFRGLNVTGDPVFQGRTLSAWLSELPRGMVGTAWAGNFTLNNIKSRYGTGECSFVSRTGRNYRLTLELPHIYSATAGVRVLLSIRATIDGSAPTINSPVVTSMFHTIPAGNGVVDTPQSLTAHGVFSTVDKALIRTLATIEVMDSTGASVSMTTFTTSDPYYRPFRLWVEDIGLAVPDTFVPNPGGGTLAGGSPPPPPPAAKTTQTVQWGSIWSRAYRGNGQPRTDTTDLYQGYGDSYNGRNASMVGFDGDSIMSYVAGADINNVEVYVYAEHWYAASGGTAQIGIHGAASPPAATGNEAYGLLGQFHLGRGEGIWIQVPSTLWAGFRSGAYRGLTFNAPSDSSEYYGRLSGDGAATEPLIRITFTK